MGRKPRGPELTDRERQVLAALAEGLSNDEIAARLFLARNTVKSHLERIRTTLDVSGRTALIAEAYRLGIVTVPRGTPTTVRDLTFTDLGCAVQIDGWTSGVLYGITDRWADGYPHRELLLIVAQDGTDATRDFTDSDPAGYPQTLGTPLTVLPDSWEPPDDAERCACGAPVRCWPDSATCAHMDTGRPWCQVCREHHREPECTEPGRPR